MLDKSLLRSLERQVFADAEATVYGVLDGASVPGLLPALEEHRPEHLCLYRGELDPELAMTAPYLARLEPESAFTRWMLGEGWGHHWGILAVSRAALPELRRHFRSLLIVYGPAGQPLYFRYYDPRVLRAYLPTCEPGQAGALFGPVHRYLAEGEEIDRLHRFWLAEGRPGTDQIRLTPARQPGRQP